MYIKSKIFTTGIWNLPIIRANPIVGVDPEWPSTACAVRVFVQFLSSMVSLCPLAKSIADFIMFVIPQELYIL